MTDLFPVAMAFNWLPENDGQPYHTTPGDPGGATSWGVVYTTYASWRKIHGVPSTQTGFADTPRDAFLPLYRTWYWDAARCGELGPAGVEVFDAAVNCGPGNAVRFLQHVVGTTQDGIFGPITMAATRATDPEWLIRAFEEEREDYYAVLSDFAYFGRGWDRRAAACRDLSLSLLTPADPPPPFGPPRWFPAVTQSWSP